MSGKRSLWFATLRCVAAAMAAVYVAWQVIWLVRGQLPPALFLAATGLPAPTSGGTRSVLCLLNGDWKGSLHHNALAVPIAVLALGSAACVTGQTCRGRRVHLPRGAGVAWAVILTLAWVVKLTQVALTR